MRNKVKSIVLVVRNTSVQNFQANNNADFLSLRHKAKHLKVNFVIYFIKAAYFFCAEMAI